MRARYNRISTANQNLERQLVKQHPDEVIYNDVIGGSTPFSSRPKGLELINAVKTGEVKYISVASIDRLGRNTVDVLQTLEILDEYKTTLKVDNLGLESQINGKPNQVFKLISSVLANVSQMERENLLERQREGVAIAKAKGVYKGRVRGSVESEDLILLKHKEVVKFIKQNQSLRNTAKLAGVSLGTVQKVKKIYLKDYKNC